MFSFVHKIVLFGAFPRAKNALDRAFCCSPSCQKPCSRSCFVVLSFVPKIVLYGALLRASNLLFWCFPSWQKSCSRSCFLVLSFVPKIVLAVTAIRLVWTHTYTHTYQYYIYIYLGYINPLIFDFVSVIGFRWPTWIASEYTTCTVRVWG